MTQFRRGINWNTVSEGDSMSPFCATDVRTWATGSPKRVVSVRGGNVRRASRRRAARARSLASQRGASISPSWPGAPCALGAAELAAHPWSRPSSMPANHAAYSRRTRRDGAARAMARHAGYRRRSGPRHGACVARGRIAKAPVSAEAATGTHQWLHRRREVEASVPRWRAPYPLCYAEADTGPTTVPILLKTRMQAR